MQVAMQAAMYCSVATAAQRYLPIRVVQQLPGSRECEWSSQPSNVQNAPCQPRLSISPVKLRAHPWLSTPARHDYCTYYHSFKNGHTKERVQIWDDACRQ